jgi:FAD/FMN-containing dehydrogenase
MTHTTPTSIPRLMGPRHPSWEAGRHPFNLSVDQRPALLALPEDARAVTHVVRFAAHHGWQVAPQATGHGAAPLGDLAEIVLLRTSNLNGVELDVEARRARVEAGARWSDLVPAASDAGLAALHGTAGALSIAGYSLAGGIGWYARKFGLQANAITAIELVTAEAEFIRVDHDSEPELFWALRGGSGGFGVVTAIEFELQPLPQVYAGALFFQAERASEVLHRWREWTGELPEEMTSIARLLRLPDIELVPTPMRGRAFAQVEAVFGGDPLDGERALKPLRELGPEIDTLAAGPPAKVLPPQAEQPMAFVRGATLLDDLTADALDRLIEAAGPGSGSPLAAVELRHLGGAAGRREPGHGALGAVDGSALVVGMGMHHDAESRAAAESQLASIEAALDPFAAARRVAPFADQRGDASNFFDPPTVERLRRVKERFDPDGLFHANHDLTESA